MLMMKLPNVDIPKVNGKVTFDFELPDSVVAGRPFPEAAFVNGAIPLVDINAHASKEISFGTGERSVKFGFDGGGHAALGVYRTTKNLFRDLKDVGLTDEVAELLGFDIDKDDNLIAVRWGYDLGANAQGMTLGSPIMFSVGASAKKNGLFAVLHAVKRTRGARLSIKDALMAWRVPSLINTIDDLEPKTTIITESAGSLGVSLGVEYGFSYNWTKEAQTLGGLEGDIGLKIDAGIKGHFESSIEGLFSLAISRESDAKKVRIRVFRSGRKATSLGFSAGLDMKFSASDGLTPEKFQDFLKGVFNLHDSQVLKDFNEWAHSDQPLEVLLGNGLGDYAKELAGNVTGKEIDRELDKATALLKDSIKKWHGLPQELSGVIRDVLKDSTEAAKFRSFLEEVVALSGKPDDLVELVGTEIASVRFFEAPIGKWLALAGKDSATSIIANLEDERSALIEAAKTTLAILDGGNVESTLAELHKLIGERLAIDKLMDLDADVWMKQRLSDFLGSSIGTDRLKEIRNAMISMDKKADDFYQLTKKAILSKYNFSMSAAFSSESSNKALIDLTIDYDAADSAAAANKSLKEALSGNFKGLLGETRKGVTLNSALLTHGFKRSSSVEINLPFFETSAKHINSAISEARPEATSEGRIWLYTVSALDIKARKNRFLSKLTITSGTSSGHIREFDTAGQRANYQLRIAKEKATTRFVERRMEHAVTTYLSRRFPTEDSFSAYLIELNNAVDVNNVGSLGNLVVSLDVSIPGKFLKAWHKLPPLSEEKTYKAISTIIQKNLRSWLPAAYIYDPERQFGDRKSIFPLLAYAALPVYHDRIEDGIYHWRSGQKARRKQVFNGPQFVPNLSRVLERLRGVVPEKQRKVYDPSMAVRIVREVLSDEIETGRLKGLCALEYNLLKGIKGTAKHHQRFRKESANQNLEAANKYLGKFAAELVETFNDDIGGYYAGKTLRPLGLMLMYEVAKLLDPAIEEVRPTAMLRAMVVKDSVPFEKEAYLDGRDPSSADMLIETLPIVEIPERSFAS